MLKVSVGILWNWRVYEGGNFMWKGKGKEICIIWKCLSAELQRRWWNNPELYLPFLHWQTCYCTDQLAKQLQLILFTTRTANVWRDLSMTGRQCNNIPRSKLNRTQIKGSQSTGSEQHSSKHFPSRTRRDGHIFLRGDSFLYLISLLFFNSTLVELLFSLRNVGVLTLYTVSSLSNSSNNPP